MKTTCLPLAAVLAAAITLSGCGKAMPAAPTAPQAQLATRSVVVPDAKVTWAIDSVLATKTKYIVLGQTRQTAPFQNETPLEVEIAINDGVKVDGLPANPEAVKRLLTSAKLGPNVTETAMKRALSTLAGQAGQGEWTLESTSSRSTQKFTQDFATVLKGRNAAGEPFNLEIRVEYLRITRVYVKVNGQPAAGKAVVQQLVGAKLAGQFPATAVNGAIALLTDPQHHLF